MSFKLASSDSTFNNRVDALLDSLEEASKIHSPTPSISLLSDNENSCFKKPFMHPKRRMGSSIGNRFDKNDISNKRSLVPDFDVNPSKWTCYSLKDTECQGDGQNRAIASKLISSIKHSTELPYEQSNDQKIQFRKPAKATTSIVTDQCLRKSENNFVLPTYEVGKTNIKKNIIDRTVKKDKKHEICLSYLYENGDID